jgi:hypothetical protein
MRSTLGFLAPLLFIATTANDASAAAVTLSSLGVTVDLPGGWNATSATPIDSIERVQPSTPFIGISFALMKNDTECDVRLLRMTRAAGGEMQPRPSYVPTGYSRKIADVSIKYGQGTSRHEIIACAITGAGALHASVQFDVPLATEDFTMVRVALDRVAAAVDRIAGPKPSSGSSSDSDTSSESSEGPDHNGGPYELSAVMIKPQRDDQTTGYGATIGLDLTEVLGDSSIGFAYNFSGAIGGDSASHILYDTHLGLGLGIRIPHIELIPLVSLGIDGGSGAGDLPNGNQDFNLDAAGYWSLGGRARLRFSSQAFELGFDRVTRGSFFSGPRADIGRENRFQLKYLIAGKIRPYVGVRYIDYQAADATSVGGGAGIGLMFGFKL